MTLSDSDIATAFQIWKQKHYPQALPQHLSSYLETYLEKCTWYQDSFPPDRMMLLNRVLSIVRSEGGRNAAVTKRKNKARESAAHEKAKQGILL